MQNRLLQHERVLYLAVVGGVVTISAGVVVGANSNGKLWLSLALIMQALGASILFPILVSFAYDRLRERWLGDEVWRIFNELSDGGIVRVYRDREFVPDQDNAQTRLSEHFQAFQDGEVKLMGASLRVFFNPLGPFYHDIDKMLNNEKVGLKALVSCSTSPEATNRTKAEEPGLAVGAAPQSQRDLESSIANARNLSAGHAGRVQVARYQEAPYCTAIIFPDICFFSPNIIAPDVPVRLPMILFRADSHGYRMISASFDTIWASDTSVDGLAGTSTSS